MALGSRRTRTVKVFLVERWIEAQPKKAPEPQPVSYGAGSDDDPAF